MEIEYNWINVIDKTIYVISLIVLFYLIFKHHPFKTEKIVIEQKPRYCLDVSTRDPEFASNAWFIVGIFNTVEEARLSGFKNHKSRDFRVIDLMTGTIFYSIRNCVDVFEIITNKDNIIDIQYVNLRDNILSQFPIVDFITELHMRSYNQINFSWRRVGF